MLLERPKTKEAAKITALVRVTFESSNHKKTMMSATMIQQRHQRCLKAKINEQIAVAVASVPLVI